MIQELQYPFDANYILTHKKRLRRLLLEDGTAFLHKKIAILGGSTTHDIRETLDLFLLSHGIQAEFYESEYGQYYEDAVFPNTRLTAFAPDVIYIHTTNRNISRYPTLDDQPETVETLLRTETEKFHFMWDKLAQQYHCPVIQNNFELPPYRLLGSMDATDIHGAVNFINRLNLNFAAYAQTHSTFYICDIHYLSADFGLSAWSDPYDYYMYKYAVSLRAIPMLSHHLANMIKALYGKNKKGLVLDLDNTLWGGVIGDDGVERILLGADDPEGMAYSAFQGYLKQLKSMGVLLSVNSKNDYEIAMTGLRHPDSILQARDFATIQANWEPKDRNFGEIAAQLNLLPESLVFVDDNPAERKIVQDRFPGVSAPPVEDICHAIQILDRSGFFEVMELTADDLRRSEMYLENRNRELLRESFADNYDAYLQSLEMHAQICAFEPLYFSRIAQLTNKTNQFNLTTKRFTEDEIKAIAASPNAVTLYARLTDRFGDNGIVSLLAGTVEGDICSISLWCMSCRVLKRGLELAMMDQLVAVCQSRGIRWILGKYIPTAKNGMVKAHYAGLGFEMTEQDASGITSWRFAVSADYSLKNKYIAVHPGENTENIGENTMQSNRTE